MKSFLIIIISVLIQSSTPLFEIPTEANQIYSDNLGNLYVVKDFTLYKYNTSGRLLFTYSDNFMGNISSISIGEGLKVLVYYRDNGHLVVLDNTLSQIAAPVNLNYNNLGTTTLATSSVQNSFWFYNPIDGTIIRTTNTISVIFNSGNLSQLLNIQINPIFMVEYSNKLYLNDPDVGIMVFDIFGTYLKTIPITGLLKFQVTEKGLYFYSNNHLFFYDFQNFNQIEIPLPITGALQALVSNKMLFIQTNLEVSGWDRKTGLK
jgi:hypothetical protein